MARAAVLTYSAMLLVRHYRYDLRQSMASRTCKRALRHQLKECWEALKDRSEPVWAGRTAVRRSQKGKWRAAAAPFTDRSTSCWVVAPCTSPDFSKFGDRARISLDSPSHAAHEPRDAACVRACVRGPAGPAEVEVFGSRRASEALQELCHEMIGINLSCSAHNASTCPEIPRTVDILLPIYCRFTAV